MTFADLVIANLTSPAILCFFLGIIAALVKSDLRVPPAVHETISIYLLFAIGLKGGFAIANSTFQELILPALATVTLGIITPLLAFILARNVGKLNPDNAAAIAAHYGSVSAVTFMAAISFASISNIETEAFLPALVALLEIPGILIALVINLRYHKGEDSKIGVAIHEILTAKTMMLLIGGVIIGALSGNNGKELIKPVFFDAFQGILTFFLLEMGIIAAARLREAKHFFWFLLGYGIAIPLLFSVLGALAGFFSGLSIGGSMVLATMAASASYIAAPAAVKISIPTANPAIYLTASIGITLPFNLIVGIPLYYQLVQWVFAAFS
jgi:hypothetical protein